MKTNLKRNQRGLSASGGGYGFSLVELLVCIAIIGVLSAFTYSTTSWIRKNSMRASAVSNMRGLCQAAAAYAQDHNGDVFPYRSTQWGDRMYWSQYLPFYYANGATQLTATKGDDLKQADKPTKLRVHPPDPRVGNTNIYWSYARNNELPKPSDKDYTDYTVQYIRLPNPARTMLFIETRQHPTMYSHYPLEYFVFDKDGPDGRTLAAFLDGHTELVTREAIIGENQTNMKKWTEFQRLFWLGYPNATTRQDY